MRTDDGGKWLPTRCVGWPLSAAQRIGQCQPTDDTGASSRWGVPARGVMTSVQYPHGGSTHWSVPEEHIAPRTISLWDRFLPRCFRRGCFLLRMELSPAKRPGQPAKCAKGAPETSAVAKFEPVNNANGVLEFRADWGAPPGSRGAQLQRTSGVLRGDSSKRAPSSTKTSRSCVVKNSYPLTVPKCSPLPG